MLFAALSLLYFLIGEYGQGQYPYSISYVYGINNAQYQPIHVQSLPTVNDPELM